LAGIALVVTSTVGFVYSGYSTRHAKGIRQPRAADGALARRSQLLTKSSVALPRPPTHDNGPSGFRRQQQGESFHAQILFHRRAEPEQGRAVPGRVRPAV